jgi:gliding motility-associated-like protein
MTARFLVCLRKFLFSMLMLIVISISAHSQVDTIVNKYAKVLTRSDYQITVDNASDFSNGDYVLLIQMKGVSIDPGNGAGYGSIADVVGSPGQYEFLIINTVSANTITFLSKIKKYDPAGFVQLVKVPFLNSLTVGTGKKLTCPAWNPSTGTGGVLALIVGKTLKLKGDIDVSGKGFKGAQIATGMGICAYSSGINMITSFDPSYQNAGYKGEGIASHYTPFIGSPPIAFTQSKKGNGPMFNGGGGGNGKYSGGGGGANRGVGYEGGLEDAECITAAAAVGQPGISIVDPLIDTVSNTGGVFLGGGGGASTYLSGANARPGGNGGGIVLIISDAIEGNGRAITASGDSATTAVNDVFSGAGGGGAGGSVMIFSQSYSTSDLYIKVNGSKGGDVYHDVSASPTIGGGTGGAGGGGYVGLLKPETSTVHINKSGGGNSSIKYFGFPTEVQANSGGTGLVRTGVAPVLTGFLFNSISSVKTGNQIDSTCSNVPFGVITGTSPVGGKLPYTIWWEKSTDGTTFTVIPGVTSLNYTPGSLSVTTWFRRIIQDNSTPAIIDISKPVKVIVHPKILNNIIVASPDSICFATDPQLIKQGVPDLVVPQSKGLSFVWQDSTVGGVWGASLETTFKVKEFDPNPSGGLVKDTWYRRVVFSGSCTDRGAITKVTVIPVIQNNAFTKLLDTICFGGNTNLATIAGPTGGVTGKYKYQWESSTVSSTTGPWAPIAGETSAAYDPDASVSLSVGNHFYRRIVYSGELNTCKDITTAASRKVWPVITNNSKISPDITIGYDSIPPKIIATDTPPLAGGDGTFKYFWQKSVSIPTWSNATGDNLKKDYSPPNLQATTWFRRRVNSSVCTSVSDSVKITADAKIINTISLFNPALDTIYTGGTSSVVSGLLPTGGSGVPNDYSYKWYKSTEAAPTASGWTLINGAVSQDYNPGILTQTTWYRRDVSSPAAATRSTVKSNFLKVTVLPKIQNFNITSSQTICPGDQPAKLQGNTQVSGGDGKYKYTWQDSTSGHSWSNIASFIKVSSPDYNPPALFPPETKYRRIVYSGKNDCATETSNYVKILFDKRVTQINAGKDTILHSFDNVFRFDPDPIQTWETGEWSSDKSYTYIDRNGDKTADIVQGLSPGLNTFVWKVTSGTCDTSDILNVTVTKIEVPEGFSPNNDGYNDIFEILGLDLDNQIAELSIQNSSGAVVFSTTNRVSNEDWIGWDGKNSKGIDLPEGTYYYLLKITSDPAKGGTGEVEKWNGFIVLKRY